MSFVLDNSVTMRWCFNDGSAADLAYAERVMDALADDSALAPSLWSLEVVNVLARAEHHGHIDTALTAAFLDRLRKLRIMPEESSFEVAITGILEAARRHHLTAYDASYLELAARKRLPLATLDASLRKAARREGVRVF